MRRASVRSRLARRPARLRSVPPTGTAVDHSAYAWSDTPNTAAASLADTMTIRRHHNLPTRVTLVRHQHGPLRREGVFGSAHNSRPAVPPNAGSVDEHFGRRCESRVLRSAAERAVSS